MPNTLKTYRFPIILTISMLAFLSIWAFHTCQEIIERSHSRQRLRFDIAANNLIAIDQHCQLQNEVIQKVISNSIQNSPFSFFILERNGKADFKIGDAPDSLNPQSSEGEKFEDNEIYFWKTLETVNSGNKIMIMGGNLEKDRGYIIQSKNLVITVSLALLVITANLIAWIMMIRSRKLSEQLEAQRARSAYLEDLELAAAGLAHETKNPLGIISGIAQQISREPDIHEETLKMIESIIDEVDKAASRLGHFLTFAKHREVKAVRMDVRKSIQKVVGVLQAEFDSVGVKLEVKCPEIAIIADEDMLRQILVNLLLNSLHASAGGTMAFISVSRNSDIAEILVEDQGTGINSDLLPNIFKPYVAGFPDGHGLGLAIVKRLVENHGWTIKAESNVNKGTAVKISGIMISDSGEGNS
ncbi:ATP-binding protein [Desulforegula conservatrix]|uniref:ATP-binding protein n=1 Tax=Desulforegula conservatrix TaxID=153026 RepID=UPI00041E8B62|nr:HAMP domain-containing sensor histidine kinase [Desulforegula conservatrix]